VTPLRVLHCPADVGGHPSGLARAERDLGLDSHVVAFEDSPFRYGTDEVLWRADDGIFKRETLRFGLLWRALREFDVIHFNFGQSIMPLRYQPEPPVQGARQTLRRAASHLYTGALGLRDLPLLKAARKTIVVTYQGDDARQGDYLREHFELSIAQGVEPGYYTPDSDERKRASISRIARYADHIYSLNPDLLHVLPARAEFLPYANVDPRDCLVAAPPGGSARPPIVAHAPTHRGVKGTPAILAACDQLRSEGVEFELDVIEGVTREAALARYERADLVVDQLLAGWYGGVAVEVMALGRPAIAYLREADLGYLPAEMRSDLPVIDATPATVVDVLRRWLTDRRHELPEVGRLAREYVERWHDPQRLAVRVKADYESARVRMPTRSSSPSRNSPTAA
jgi:hypothetical protein